MQFIPPLFQDTPLLSFLVIFSHKNKSHHRNSQSRLLNQQQDKNIARAGRNKKDHHLALGPDDGKANGLLLKKLDNIIATCTNFPNLFRTQTQSMSDLVCQLSVDTEQGNRNLCTALLDIAHKYASFEVLM